MDKKIYYHLYDLVLPALFDKARAIYSDPTNAINEIIRNSQLSNIGALEDIILEEQQLERKGDIFPLLVLPPDSNFYAHFLSIRLGIEPPAKARFILDHHKANFAGNRYYTKDQFTAMVEYIIITSVDRLKMPDTLERCDQIANWISRQEGKGQTESRPAELFFYWPYPIEKLDALYEFLLANDLIEPNTAFRDSFRLFFVDSALRTIWKGDMKVLVGLFYKVYGFLAYYKSEAVRTKWPLSKAAHHVSSSYMTKWLMSAKPPAPTIPVESFDQVTPLSTLWV